MSAFTPGPWSVNTAGSGRPDGSFRITEYYVYADSVGADIGIAGDIADPVTGEPCEANARLIAAAPDLHDIAKGVLVALSYPRGSEAQIRCLEEVGQDANFALLNISGAPL